MPVFPFIVAGHPFHALLEDLRAAIAARGHDADAPQGVVSSEVKGRPTEDGAFSLDRFYWSLQRAASPGTGFSADSLYLTAREGEARWYRFPDEPRLAALGAYLEGRGLRTEADGLEVLRYVPLRRFTFRAPRRDGSPGREIAKLKRATTLRGSYERLEAVARAAADEPGLGVPAPAGMDEAHGLFFQEDVRGTDLATRAGDGDAQALPRAAEVLAAFHGLDGDALPEEDAVAARAARARDLDWIAFNAPHLRDLVERARPLLPEGTSGPPATCHGDFVPSHVIVDGATTWVIDLDLAHRGDPVRELAMLLGSLRTDAPGVAADEAAIVAAYEGRAGRRVDPRRLARARVAAEVYRLALAFTKDRPADPAPLATAVERARDIA